MLVIFAPLVVFSATMPTRPPVKCRFASVTFVVFTCMNSPIGWSAVVMSCTVQSAQRLTRTPPAPSPVALMLLICSFDWPTVATPYEWLPAVVMLVICRSLLSPVMNTPLPPLRSALMPVIVVPRSPARSRPSDHDSVTVTSSRCTLLDFSSSPPVVLRSSWVRTSDPVLAALNEMPGSPLLVPVGWTPRSLRVESVASKRPPPETVT